MKTIMKLSLIAAALAALSTAAAYADDQQLQNRLARQRAQAQECQTTATMAVYAAPARSRASSAPTVALDAHSTGIGRADDYANRSEPRFMQANTPQGGSVGYFAPDR